MVSAKYSAPSLLVERIGQKEYRERLHRSEQRLGAGLEGLRRGSRRRRSEGQARRQQPFDTYEAGGKRTAFDGDWKKQKLSEQDYMKAFAAADERYSQMLTALLAQMRPSS